LSFLLSLQNVDEFFSLKKACFFGELGLRLLEAKVFKFQANDPSNINALGVEFFDFNRMNHNGRLSPPILLSNRI
jgi:hypothetical protein